MISFLALRAGLCQDSATRNASWNSCFSDPWGGTPGRRYTHSPCLYCFQDELHRVREGIMDTCSSSVWHHDSAFHSIPNSPKPTSAIMRHSRSSRARVLTASGSREAWRPVGRPGEVLGGQLCWGAAALVKKPSWDLSYQSQRFTAVLYKTVSRWYTFHSKVFGNCQNRGNANILIS